MTTPAKWKKFVKVEKNGNVLEKNLKNNLFNNY